MKHEEKTILNKGVELAMEWGPERAKPLRTKLAHHLPDLDDNELNKFVTICEKVAGVGLDFVFKQYERATDEKSATTYNEVRDNLLLYLKDRHPWVSKKNLKTLLGQGQYYAWKEGLNT